MPPTPVPPVGVVVVGGRSDSAPSAPLGRSPTGRPLLPGSNALTGRVKVVAGIPVPPTDAPPPPRPPAAPGAAETALTAEAGVAAPAPNAPGLANMPIIDCSGCIALIGACISCDGACSACRTA